MFSVGQLVQVKTNPEVKMVVVSINDSRYTCSWVGEDGLEKVSDFSELLLEAAYRTHNESKFSPDERLYS